MSCLKCPKCWSEVSGEGRDAQDVFTCSSCGQKVRLPSRRRRVLTEAVPASCSSSGHPLPRDEEDEEYSPYNLEAAPPRRSSGGRRPTAELKRRLPLRGRRWAPPRPRGPSLLARWLPSLDVFPVLLVVLVLGCGGLALAAYRIPNLTPVACGVGGLLCCVGSIWLLAAAFQEGAGTGLACLFIPLYWLFYALTNLSTAGRPLAVMLLGCVLMLAGFSAESVPAALTAPGGPFGLNRVPDATAPTNAPGSPPAWRGW